MSTRDAEKVKTLAKEVVKECYNDKEFMDRLADKFFAVLAKKVSEEMDNKLQAFYTKSNENTEKIKNELKSVELQLDNIQRENQFLKQKVKDFENVSKVTPFDMKSTLLRINDIEQKAKLTELRIFGLNEEKGEDLKNILATCFATKLGINQVQMDNCYRVGKFIEQTRKPRPVLIRFNSVMDRNNIFHNKKKLKGTKMSISEELTKGRYELLKQTRVAFGKQYVWTRSGRIYTKVNGAIHSVRCLEDLEAILRLGQGDVN